MRVKNKKILTLTILTGCMLLGYWLWLSLRPVRIIAVHEEGSHSSVLVDVFPFTDIGKINWWLKNKEMLKEKYNIPKPDVDGSFTIVFWYFGDGYKEEGKYDRRCFDDMKTKINCIEKEKAFTVWNSRYNDMSFGVYDGEYRINKNGEMIKSGYK